MPDPITLGNNQITLTINRQGPPGLSAYQVWLAEGNVGTEQDFLDSLKAEASQVNSDWNASSGKAQILNKPTLGTAAALNVAAAGDATTAQVVKGNDTRLSDARTPLAHNQAWSTITSTPTTLSGYGITDAQPLDADLTAIAALTTSTFGRGS